MAKSREPGELCLCQKCMGSKPFADWIDLNGRVGACDFDKSHGRTDHVVSVQAFAQEVDRYFRENYQRGEEYIYATADSDNPSYDTYGDTYNNILVNDLDCDEKVLSAVLECLPDYDHADVSSGEEPFYDDCINYESIAEADGRDRADAEEYWYENRFSYQWKDFCQIIQYERRFFKIKELLDDLFGKPDEYTEGKIRPMYALRAGQRIFRARLLDDEFSERRLNENATAELSAPPKLKAQAGRMNVEYIPAFYAAFSEDTAIAEVRPSIGDQVAVGEFVLQRELKVFDFTTFSKVEADKWTEAAAHTRFDFIRQMEAEISKPILPHEKQREYIATQVVAEYLREYFDCDAVIYQSAMHKSETVDTRNIVIFYRGTDFVAEGATLSLSRHDVATVSDVIYSVIKIPF
jgi:hypothetical protein